MGKLFIANDTKLICKGLSIFEKSEMKITNRDRFSKETEIITYGKLNVETRNSYIDENIAIYGVGTFIYKEKIDREALKSIARDFDNLKISELRSNIIGDYCICIKQNGRLYIFVDDNAVYNMYYYSLRGNFVLNNSYFHIASILNLSEVNELFQICLLNPNIPCTNGLYSNIKKIEKNEILIFDDTWKIEKTSIVEKKYEYESIWENMLKEYACIPKLFNTTGVFLTGGKDSRLTLSALLKFGCKPNLYYGIGNSILTNTKNEDLDIVGKISEKENLILNALNWKEANPTEQELKEHITKFGEIGLTYGANKNIFDEFKNNVKSEFVDFGYFGEVYRTEETLENLERKESYSFDNVLDWLIRSSNLDKITNNIEGFKHAYKEELLDFMRRIDISIDNIKLKDVVKIENNRRLQTDTVMTNIANIYTYSFGILGQSRYMNYLNGIEPEEKFNSRMIISGIKFFRPELMKIDFFSHINRVYYSEELNAIVMKDKLLSRKEQIRKLLKFSPKLLQLTKKIYYKYKGDTKGYNEVFGKEYVDDEVIRLIYSYENRFIDNEKTINEKDINVVLLLALTNKMLDINKEK